MCSLIPHFAAAFVGLSRPDSLTHGTLPLHLMGDIRRMPSHILPHFLEIPGYAPDGDLMLTEARMMLSTECNVLSGWKVEQVVLIHKFHKKM